MTKAFSKSRLNKKTPEKKTKFSAETKNKLLFFAIVAIMAAIPFALGKYFEFNTPGPFDSGAYVYSAKHILEGAKIGVDEKPSALPGTLLMNIIGVKIFGFNEIGPKTIQMLLQLAALILMFIAMRKAFGNLAAAVGVIIASIYLSAPVIAKFGNVKEQYMIACMIIAISCFIIRQLDGKWIWALLAGAFLAWAPLFKPTGLSAIGAMGIFVILCPVLKYRTWKQTGIDISLILGGAVISLLPMYLWYAITKIPAGFWPYNFVWKSFVKKSVTAAGGSYVTKSRAMSGFSEQWPRVLRYYAILMLPVAIAVSSIISWIVRFFMQLTGKLKLENRKVYERFVILLAVWWILDIAFVWISPRSYEQYYLPLNASAAMLSGYILALYSDKLKTSIYKTKWILLGLAGLICMIAMSWHIFFGIEKSPHSGTKYPKKRRGYAQKYREVSNRKNKNYKGAWELAGEYIYKNSNSDDRIYVWGWVPGIYVKAQRLSSTPKAFEGTMHTLSAEALSKRINEILNNFEKTPPKFIVDTHKVHFPWKQPPLELWPRTSQGFLPNNSKMIASYDAAYSKMLAEKVSEDEALRYKKMTPFRKFVMDNYRIVPVNFGQHVLFERK